MRSSSQRLVAILLAVFVLYAQYGANMHALSHATQDVADSAKATPDRQSPSGHDNCEQCLSFAAVGAALVGHVSVLLADFAHIVSTQPSLVQIVVPTTTAYLSRAPPSLLV